jgi:hypothetical protein
MACLQQTAPPQQCSSKDTTAHPHQPGARPDPHTQTQPTASATTQQKPRSGPHYGTEFFYKVQLLHLVSRISQA